MPTRRACATVIMSRRRCCRIARPKPAASLAYPLRRSRVSLVTASAGSLRRRVGQGLRAHEIGYQIATPEADDVSWRPYPAAGLGELPGSAQCRHVTMCDRPQFFVSSTRCLRRFNASFHWPEISASRFCASAKLSVRSARTRSRPSRRL
jgi:hypothetical protein